jgi:predicted transcriptional regulator of viral defense system
VKRQKTVDILRALPGLFKYADASKFTENPNVFLTRALKAGYVARISRGTYYNTFKEPLSVEEVACYLRTPSYISCEWALNYHNVLLQVPTVCTVITLSTSVGERARVHYKNVVIEYSKISERLFFGFEPAKGFNIAVPEKAVLDAVYLRSHIPFVDELELARLDMAKLKEFSEKYPLSVQKKVDALNREELKENS